MLPKTKLIIASLIVLTALFVVSQLKESGSDDIQTMLAQETQSPQETQDWKEFIPQSNRFKVMLPALPQHAAEVVPLPSGQGIIKYDMYLSQEKDGSTFMISMIQYPDSFDVSKPEELLEGVMKELLAGSSNNKLISQQMGQFQHSLSLDFSIRNNDVFIHGKTFFVGKTLYVLILSDRSDVTMNDEFEKFIQSFEIIQETVDSQHMESQQEQLKEKHSEASVESDKNLPAPR